jgi:hypothetical protein
MKLDGSEMPIVSLGRTVLNRLAYLLESGMCFSHSLRVLCVSEITVTSSLLNLILYLVLQMDAEVSSVIRESSVATSLTRSTKF